MFRLAVSHGATDQVINHGCAWKGALDILVADGKLNAAEFYVAHDVCITSADSDAAAVLRFALFHAIDAGTIQMVSFLIGVNAEVQFDSKTLFEESILENEHKPSPRSFFVLAALMDNHDIFEILLRSFPLQKLDDYLLGNALNCAVFGGNSR